ncbi:LPS-assembly protein LptD [Celeribacter neptunius]|uniref:LPS-assembly protein LptD n=1 Tax=Celeribacter neptunius TaxID=588602 RepID=A0A1I3KF52_9RHOB|nr:LPS assembly protein LptD [Celeribacter neptunius]SFI71024.1 LPS-assembly protein [Celeribacter neptunius]
MTEAPASPARRTRSGRLRALALSSALFMAPLVGAPLLMAPFVPAAHAQSTAQEASTPPTALLADSVTFDGTQLIAEGHIEVLRDTTKLTASRIIYNQDTGQLSIEGPIRLTEAGSDTVLLASSAELDPALQNGLLISARAVIARQLQLAAARLDVVDGRYLRLQNSIASTCEVCAARPVPLWEIRAREVIHDSQEHQLYFTNAHLRIANIPVLWLPHLRVPDPSLKRATGFLIPEIRTDSTLGTGIEIPYFVTLGDHRDLTISPYIATRTTTLNLRYRQAFSNGTLQLNGALSSDDTRSGIRAYLFAKGNWDIAKGLNFGLDLRAASDIAYLADYGIYDSDYLPSKLTLTRYRQDEALDAELTYSRSLRGADIAVEDTLPLVLGSFNFERFLDPAVLPGRLSFGLSGSTAYRDSREDVVGYDMLRLGAETRWSGNLIFGPGLRLDNTAALMLDGYLQQHYAAYDDTVLRLTGSVETRLSWPLTRVTASGASELLEPILQLGWSDSTGGTVPNSDSQLVEFDEGNLLTLARFPGADRRTTGLTAAAGLRFSHASETTDYALSLGRVLYLEDHAEYSTASGLSGQSSDWLIGAAMRFDNGLAFNSRALIAADAEVTKWETRLNYARSRYSIGTTYSYVIANALEDRDTPLNEFGFDGTVKLARNWTASALYLYDFNENEATRAGLGLEFQNECTRLRLSLTRRFWDTEALDPTTRFAFSVGFGAFGSGKTSAGTCGL